MHVHTIEYYSHSYIMHRSQKYLEDNFVWLLVFPCDLVTYFQEYIYSYKVSCKVASHLASLQQPLVPTHS